ncbi:MAG: hypothetical protein ACE5NW_03330 [Acidiferrobacterales bacterium]
MPIYAAMSTFAPTIQTVVNVITTAIEPILDSITTPVQACVHPITAPIQPVLDTVALAVISMFNPIALAVEPLCQTLLAGFFCALGLAVETVIDRFTASVEALVNAFAAVI